MNPGPALPASQDETRFGLPANLPHFPVDLQAPDLAPWQQGNTGIAGFITRDSGLAGPHVLLISLIHGNEIAGAIALDQFLRAGFSPLRGKVTFGFANLAAFERFDPENPIASRFVEEDMNRVWDDAQLFGVRRSLELDRAREIRRLVEAADIVLDLHTMLWPSDSLLLSGPAANGRTLALKVGTPALVVADQGHAGGKRLVDYGRFTEAGSRAACFLVEAGYHWGSEALAQTFQTISRLLEVCEMVEAVPRVAPPSVIYAEVTTLVTARTNRFVFVRPFRGGEVIAAANTLIGYDGDDAVVTPHDDCLLVMPSLRPSRGHTAVRLAKIVPPDLG